MTTADRVYALFVLGYLVVSVSLLCFSIWLLIHARRLKREVDRLTRRK